MILNKLKAICRARTEQAKSLLPVARELVSRLSPFRKWSVPS